MNGTPPPFALGRCWGCGELFSFHPDVWTGCVLIDPETGQAPDTGGDPGRARRERICPDCARDVNPFRRAHGLHPIDERNSLDVARQMRKVPPLL